jgi:tRNA modification GTPase
MELLDTIAAISTPHGKGGVAVLRVSGAQAIEIASRVFVPKSGKTLAECAPRTAAYGAILAPEGEEWLPVDDGLAIVFRAPASFTGEDTVEINCHGGILLTQTVLSALLTAGARMARPGEFTRRAFLNGKIGLGAAEAVGSLLEAQNRGQMTLALGGLHGKLESRSRVCYEQLRAVLTSVLACIDFPDEDLAEMSREDMITTLSATERELVALGQTYRTGHAIAEGIPTVICGRTNVGKSSLYNRLLGREAAIVTDIEGTTRDILCETTTLGQVTLRLFDTAGLRDTDDTVERIGIDRARRAMDEAELILALFDLTRPLTDEEHALLDELAARDMPRGTVIALLNKFDAVCDTRISSEVCAAVTAKIAHSMTISAKSGAGIEALADLVDTLFVDGTLSLRDDAVVVNARQMATVTRAVEALRASLDALRAGLPMDLCCVDLTAAMSALSELDGREIGEDVVNEIFSHFCVGK